MIRAGGEIGTCPTLGSTKCFAKVVSDLAYIPGTFAKSMEEDPGHEKSRAITCDLVQDVPLVAAR